MEFLEHLETQRGNTASTRNTRLAAIKSFMRFCEHREPSILEQSRRVLAIPFKRTDVPLVDHLSITEMQANLPLAALDFQPSPRIRVRGKGRRERCLPLWKQTAADLRAWLAVRGDALTPELFLNARDRPMTRSGFEYVLRKHVGIAAERHPSLKSKRVSPHVLRHTCALMILQATGDLRRVSLWLGHADMQTTEMYLRADPTDKLEAIEAIIPPALKRGRFQAPDKLIASLQRS